MNFKDFIKSINKYRNKTLSEFKINLQGIKMQYFAQQNIVDWLNCLYEFYDSKSEIKKEIEIVELNDSSCFAKCQKIYEQLETNIENFDWRLFKYYSYDIDCCSYIASDKSFEHFFIFTNVGIEHQKINTMRLVREVFTYALVFLGWIPLHASAIQYRDKGVILIGQRYAGKTYTMLDMLFNSESKYISNDKIFLKESQGKIKIFALPKKIGIRWSTLNENPEYMVSFVPFYINGFNNYKQNNKFMIENQNDLEKKVHLLPNELAKLINKPIITECDLNVVLGLNKFEDSRLTIKSTNLINLQLEDHILNYFQESFLFYHSNVNYSQHFSWFSESIQNNLRKIDAYYVSKPYQLERLLSCLDKPLIHGGIR